MIITEEEAKTKWCPMVRTHIVNVKDYYGDTTAAGSAVNKCTKRSVCIASACMMWRWVDGEMVNFPLACGYGVFCGMVKSVNDEDPGFPCSALPICREWYRRHGDIREIVCKDRRGYCSLTGKAVIS